MPPNNKQRSKKVVLAIITSKRPDLEDKEKLIERLKEIETREEFEDLELDTVIRSKKNTDPVLLTLTERNSRYELIIKITPKQIKQ